MAAVVLGLSNVGMAQTSSPVVGYNTFTVPTNSDAVLAVGFNDESAGSGAATGVAGSVITDSGASFGDFTATPHYVRFTSGARSGEFSTITANTATTITVEDATGVVISDTFEVFPHKTLGSVFPDIYEGTSFIESTLPFGAGILTQVLLPDSTVGSNRSFPDTFFFFGGEWRKFGAGGNFDNQILAPGSTFILRNTDASTTLTFYASGVVNFGSIAVNLVKDGSVDNDIYISTGRPTPLTLGELGISGTPAFETSTLPFGAGIRDQILIYNNSATGQNKAPADTYFFFSGEWRKFGEAGDFTDVPVIPAGEGFVIRRVSGTASTDKWTAPSPY